VQGLWETSILLEQLADIVHLALADCEGAKSKHPLPAEEDLPRCSRYEASHVVHFLPCDRYYSLGAR
jgi:hypothetical protein